MAAQTVKIRLRSGAREIELEGSRADVDDLLERWWPDRGEPEIYEERVKPRQTRSQQRKQADRNGSDNASASFDANRAANHIKDSDDFSLIETKVLHVDGEPYRKAAIVLWLTDQPLTSGDIHRVLQGLDVRIDLGNLSKALKKNIRQFVTSKPRSRGGGHTRYQLTSKARADFESWLRSKDGE